MKEIELQVTDFNEFTKFLGLFSILQPACQVTINRSGIEVFGKFLSGRCDLFSNSVSISPMCIDAPESITIFITDLKKFLYTLGMLEKYYDMSDSSLFLTQDIRFMVGEDASYFRISSKKYTIKFQLSSNAIVKTSLGDASNYKLSCTKYATAAHAAFLNGKDILSELNFLVAFKTDKKRIANVSSLLSTLNNADDVKIKLEIPEQVTIETDLTDSSASSMTAMPNTLYAILADNQKLITSRLGNKVCAVLGDITNLHADYRNYCRVDSLTENFVYLLTTEQLKLVSAIISSFAPAVVKPVKKSKKAAGEEIPPEQPEGNLEIGISKINLMHLNLISQNQNCTSEFYVSLIGRNAD